MGFIWKRTKEESREIIKQKRGTKNEKVKEKVKSLLRLKRKSSEPPTLPHTALVMEPSPVDALAAAIEALNKPTTENAPEGNRPILRIDTTIPPPPPTLDGSFQIQVSSPIGVSSVISTTSSFHRQHSLPSTLRTPYPPTPSPTSSSSSRRSSFSSFFKRSQTRRQEEIRRGKLPAIPRKSVESPASTEEEQSPGDLATEDIEDPSSSTTYNPENRRKSSTPSANEKQTPVFLNRPLIFTSP